MRLLEFIEFLFLPIIMMAQFQLVALPFAQATPGAPPIGGRQIDFDCDLEVELELAGPNQQRIDMDMVRNLFGGEIFKVEVKVDSMEMMNSSSHFCTNPRSDIG